MKYRRLINFIFLSTILFFAGCSSMQDIGNNLRTEMNNYIAPKIISLSISNYQEVETNLNINGTYQSPGELGSFNFHLVFTNTFSNTNVYEMNYSNNQFGLELLLEQHGFFYCWIEAATIKNAKETTDKIFLEAVDIPTIEIEYPKPNNNGLAAVNKEVFTFSGLSKIDSAYHVSDVRFIIANTNHTLTNNASLIPLSSGGVVWQFKTKRTMLVQGSNHIIIYSISDRDKVSEPLSFDLIVDPNLAYLEITEPLDGMNLAREFTVEGIAQSISGISNLSVFAQKEGSDNQYQRNGVIRPLTNIENGLTNIVNLFSADFSVARKGYYQLWLVATNGVGIHTETDPIRVQMGSLPIIELDTPQTNFSYATNESGITFSGSSIVEDYTITALDIIVSNGIETYSEVFNIESYQNEISTNLQIEVTTNQALISDSGVGRSASWSWTSEPDSGVVTGTNFLYIIAQSSAGTYSRPTKHILVVDSAPPQVSFDPYVNGQVITKSTNRILVSGTAVDESLTNLTVFYQKSGMSSNFSTNYSLPLSDDNSFYWNLTNLSPGNFLFWAEAYDKAGWKQTTSTQICSIASIPSISITYPSNHQYLVNQSDYFLKGSALDQVFRVQKIYLQFTNQDATTWYEILDSGNVNLAESWSLNLNTYANGIVSNNGTHTIRYYVESDAGSFSSTNLITLHRTNDLYGVDLFAVHYDISNNYGAATNTLLSGECDIIIQTNVNSGFYWYRVTNDNHNDSTYDGDAIRSGYFTNGTNTLSIMFSGTNMTFWRKHETLSTPNPSEKDFIQWKIDDETNWNGGWAGGPSDWTEQRYTNLNNGLHIIHFQYIKNGTVSNGQDAFWIDKIEINRTNL